MPFIINITFKVFSNMLRSHNYMFFLYKILNKKFKTLKNNLTTQLYKHLLLIDTSFNSHESWLQVTETNSNLFKQKKGNLLDEIIPKCWDVMISSLTISRGSKVIKTLAVSLSFAFSLCWPHFWVGSPYIVADMSYFIFIAHPLSLKGMLLFQ